jgi:hypothetical protein
LEHDFTRAAYPLYHHRPRAKTGKPVAQVYTHLGLDERKESQKSKGWLPERVGDVPVGHWAQGKYKKGASPSPIFSFVTVIVFYQGTASTGARSFVTASSRNGQKRSEDVADGL